MRAPIPLMQKKARITRIRAYRNYYCHAVLMALNQTGVPPGGSLDRHFAMQRDVSPSYLLTRITMANNEDGLNTYDLTHAQLVFGASVRA